MDAAKSRHEWKGSYTKERFCPKGIHKFLFVYEYSIFGSAFKLDESFCTQAFLSLPLTKSTKKHTLQTLNMSMLQKKFLLTTRERTYKKRENIFIVLVWPSKIQRN
jgi:hypothetical protein